MMSFVLFRALAFASAVSFFVPGLPLINPSQVMASQSYQAELPPLVEGPLFSGSSALHEDDPSYSSRRRWETFRGELIQPQNEWGLTAMQAAAQKGVTTIIPYKIPENQEVRRAMEFLYGTDILSTVGTDPTMISRQVPGLAFHPGFSLLSAAYRGELNPHLGVGRIHGENKWDEFVLVKRTRENMPGQPEVMAETIRIGDLPTWNSDPVLTQLRPELRMAIFEVRMGKRDRFSADEIEKFTRYTARVIELSSQRFPQGVFIKPVESCQSGDLNQLIREFTPAETLVQDFIVKFPKMVKTMKNRGDEDEFWDVILAPDSAGNLVVHDFVARPNEVIAQAALKLKKISVPGTDIEGSLEFRVDFIQGVPIQSFLRSGSIYGEYYPDEAHAAMNLVRDFFKAAPTPYQQISGGADVAMDREGHWWIIEFNLGAESGYTNWGTQWNHFISTIIGRPTRLIQILNHVTNAALSEKIAFVESLPRSILAHPEVNDLSSVYQWLRDDYCEKFAKNPSPEAATQALDELKILFKAVPEDLKDDAQWYIDGAARYFERTLMKTASSNRI